jgi:GTP cyclohydrolase II
MENVPVRMHSECLTGDVAGSLRCDCRDQFEAAMHMIGQMENGILLYLRQEGRGIGFINKIRAYSLQDSGYDTVQANLALGFRDDERDYSVAAHMLESLKVKSIRMMTNNPKKLNALTEYGVKITERIPLVIPPNPYNEFYLRTKAEKSGHMITFTEPEKSEHMITFTKDMRFLGQIDRPVVEGMTEEQIEVWQGNESKD